MIVHTAVVVAGVLHGIGRKRLLERFWWIVGERLTFGWRGRRGCGIESTRRDCAKRPPLLRRLEPSQLGIIGFVRCGFPLPFLWTRTATVYDSNLFLASSASTFLVTSLNSSSATILTRTIRLAPVARTFMIGGTSSRRTGREGMGKICLD